MNKSIDEIVKTNDSAKIFELALKYYYGDEQTEINYGASIELFVKALELGEPRAKFYIAESTYLGKGIEKNYEKALELFCQVINETNNADAKFYLGEMYYLGEHVKKDYEKAYNIFEELSDQYNDMYSEYYLGVMYYYGKYVEKDYKKAYNIFNKLIEEYDKNEAKYYIALMYYYGNYKEQDKEKAYHMFKELVEKYDDRYSKYYLGCMYYNGEYVEKDYKKAYDIFENLATEFADDYAQYILGEMYYNGIFVEIDKDKGMEFYNQAAEKNNKDALIKLAKIYLEGDSPNELAAIDCYETLAKVYGDYKFKEELAIMYYNIGYYNDALHELENLISDDKTGKVQYYIGEIYLKKDEEEKAFEFFEASTLYNWPSGKIKLAEMYLSEERKNIAKALELYQSLIDDETKSAKNWAKYVLGRLYYFGKEYGYDIEQDKEKGFKLLKEAAQANIKQAIQALEEIESKNIQ